MIYRYKVTTSTGQGEGTIEADNESDAKDKLTKQFSHSEDAQFVENDIIVEHAILEIQLEAA